MGYLPCFLVRNVQSHDKPSKCKDNNGLQRLFMHYFIFYFSCPMLKISVKVGQSQLSSGMGKSLHFEEGEINFYLLDHCHTLEVW